jgi:hypothetical protein
MPAEAGINLAAVEFDRAREMDPSVRWGDDFHYFLAG